MSLAIGAANPLAYPSVGGASGAGGAPTVADASAAARNSGASTAISDFLNYAKETPAQRMREAILKSMHLTEDDLKNMSPDQRKAVEDEIAQKIKDAAEEAAKKGKTGLVADVTA